MLSLRRLFLLPGLALCSLSEAGEYRPVPDFGGGHVTAMTSAGSRVYATLFKGGLFLSEDGGRNWSKPSADPTVGLNPTLVAATPTSVYVSGQTTLYRLETATSVWEEIRPRLEPGQINYMYLRSLHADGGRIAALGQYYTYASVDDGLTWSRHAISVGGSVNSLEDMVLRGADLFAVTRDSLYRSANSGLAWTGVLALPKPLSIVKLRTGETALWAITSGGLYRCAWEDMRVGGSPAWIRAPANGIPPNRMDISGLLERDGKIWLAAPGVLFLSTDGGVNFTSLPLPSERDPGRISSVIAQGADVLFGTELEGVAAAGSDGATRFSGAGIRSRSIHSMAVHRGAAHALVSGLGLFRSRDLGHSWAPAEVFPVGAAQGRFTLLADRLALLLGSTILLFDEDSGRFEQFSVVVPGGTLLSAAWHGSNLYVGTEKDGVYSSPDSGRTWKRPQSSQFNNNFEGQSVLSLASGGSRLFLTAQGQYRTYLYEMLPDSGGWKTYYPSEVGNQDFTSVTVRGDSLLVAGSKDVCLSPDGGTTWKALGVFDTAASPYVHRIEAWGSFLAAYSVYSGAAYSEDGGATWTSLPSPGARVLSLAKAEPGRLLAGTDGLSMWNYYPSGAPPIQVRWPSRNVSRKDRPGLKIPGVFGFAGRYYDARGMRLLPLRSEHPAGYPGAGSREAGR